MQIGSRVRYTAGPSMERWGNYTGTVEYIRVAGSIDVVWDPDQKPVTKRGTHIQPNNLTEISVIDPTRPIQTTEDDPRACRIIGVLERVVGIKTILVEVPWRHTERSPSTVEINFDGVPVEDSVGAALRFRNVPQRTSGFYPLDRHNTPYGRGLISLSFAKSEHSAASFFVEIVSIDGKPTEAKIHAR